MVRLVANVPEWDTRVDVTISQGMENWMSDLATIKIAVEHCEKAGDPKNAERLQKWFDDLCGAVKIEKEKL